MNPKLLLPAGFAALALLIPQHQAQALWSAPGVCGGGAINACVDFDLQFDGEWYYFTVDFISSPDGSGQITAAGLYGNQGEASWISDAEILDPTEGWTAYDADSCHLTGDGVGSQRFLVCASTDTGINYSVGVGGAVQFRFQSDPEFTLADLGARVHIQDFTDTSCSIKLDSRIDGAFSTEGCGGTSVPEPGTMLLLGTGLAGVLGMGAIRRRREDEVTEDEVA